MSETADYGTLMKRALSRIRGLQAELDQIRSANSEPIAIIGMGCRFAGSDSPDSYWKFLKNGSDGITEVPATRWKLEDYFCSDPDELGKMYTMHGSFLDRIEEFDAHFFGIAPLDAINMDPQQRLLLEVAWEALENSGQVPGAVSRTGVYIGLFLDDYLQRSFYAADPVEIEGYNTLGLLRGLAAGRLAYVLNLHGPALQLDTACSSSLVATHLACRALRNRECDLAIAGGANVILNPEVTIGLCRMKAMARDGRCKPFSADADGYVRGEGAGAAVLKRLRDALADGDPIQAVIRGSAVNHDGRSNGLTAPNGAAQAAVIREALADAGADAAQIQYVEAHGTGTSLGDPIEALALAETYCVDRSRENRLFVGSVKSNLGHLESAAGIASLIKAALVVKHGEIPPSLHFGTPNPHIPWNSLSLDVPTRLESWPNAATRRLVGISSFGMSGTNVHMIVEQPVVPILDSEMSSNGQINIGDSAPAELFAVSAATEEALAALIQKYVSFLDETDVPLSELCRAASQTRTHFPYRVAVVANSVKQLRQELMAQMNGRASEAKYFRCPSIAFVFSGQGSDLWNVGPELYEWAAEFQKAIDQCGEILRPLWKETLVDLLFRHRTTIGSSDDQGSLQGQYTQVACFSLQYALCMLWKSWGVTPQYVLGHSLGEYAAACAAGVLCLEDALRIVFHRARLMNGLPESGGMAAVFSDEATIRSVIQSFEPNVSIAALNGAHVVISGSRDDLETAVRAFSAKGIAVRALKVTHGFHSRLMDPILSEFERIVAGVELRDPEITFVSTVTGNVITSELQEPAYWSRQIRMPVRFADAIEKACELGAEVIVEIGPSSTLTAMIRRTKDNHPDSRQMPTLLSSLETKRSPREQLLKSLGSLYANGLSVEWTTVQGKLNRPVSLPTYPFQRTRFWVAKDQKRSKNPPAVKNDGRARRLCLPFSSDQVFEYSVSENQPAYLRDHRLSDVVVVAAATYVSMTLDGLAELFDGSPCLIKDLTFPALLSISRGVEKTLQLVFTRTDDSSQTIRFASLQNDQQPFHESSWVTHCRGSVTPLPERAKAISLNELTARYDDRAVPIPPRADAGFRIGPSFQWTRSVSYGLDEVVCLLESPLPTAVVEPFQLHPGLIDSMLRTLTLCLPDREGSGSIVYVPVQIEAIRFYQKPSSWKRLWCHAFATDIADQQIAGDLRLFDDTGNCVIELTGLTARETALRSEPVAMDVPGWHSDLLQIQWQEWKPDDSTNVRSSSGATWLVLAQSALQSRALVHVLKSRGESVHVVTRGDAFERIEDDFSIDMDDFRQFADVIREVSNPSSTVNIICDLASTEDVFPITAVNLQEVHSRMGKSLLALLLACDESEQQFRLYLMTRGIQSVAISDRLCLSMAWIHGLSKVLALEHPDLQCTLVDLDPGTPPEQRGSAREMAFWADGLPLLTTENQLAIRQTGWFVPRLTRKKPDGKLQQTSQFDKNASYMVTGAFGGLGSQVVRWMAANGARHFVLVSRRTAPSDRLAEFHQLGLRVLTFQGDVAEAADVANLFESARLAMPPIKGIVHVAGVLDDGLLRSLTWDRFVSVFGPKVYGSWNLHQYSQSLNLDFFACFSSAASLVGSKGQANYAAANGFMDTLIHYRRSLGLPGITINWGAWGEAGMAVGLEDRLTALGLETIPPDVGLMALGALLQSAEAQVGLFPADWSTFVKYMFARPPGFFEHLIEPVGEIAERFLPSLKRAANSERRHLLEKHIRDLIVSVMGRNPFRSAEIEGLFELGMDSLMSLELRNRLQEDLECRLSSTITFEYPSIRALATHLDDLVNGQLASTAS